MAFCCCGTNRTVKEFTELLIHVLHVSHPAALEGSTRYAREIVDVFFSKYVYTNIDISHIEPHTHKFSNLAVESRWEIAFAGRPRGYKVPSSNLYKYEHAEGLSVVFDIETRLITRHIPPHCEYDLIEVERTDFVPLTGWVHRQIPDRVSYMNS
jgi:hypothetical protein